jgi:DNA-binding NtrC family response regulator
MLLENTQDTATIWRLAKCAGRVAALIYASPRCFPSSVNWSDFSYDEEVDRYGKHLIELALKESEGSVTDAAHLLNLSHQNLSSKLRRHKELDRFRKPVRQRSRKISDSNEPSQSLHTEEGKKTRAATILLVEDNEIVAGAVRETLELKEWTVETCMDGISALEKIASHAHYDLLLLDYELPGMNGLELVHRARRLIHRAQTAGAVVFLQKPQDIGSLVDTIGRLLHEREHED